MTQFRRRPKFEEIANLKVKKVPTISRPAAEVWRSFEAGWLKEPLANLQGNAMELQSQANVRNIAKQQAREQGLPVRHIIGEAERERRQPIDIDAQTIPSADGQDHWYGERKEIQLPLQA